MSVNIFSLAPKISLKTNAVALDDFNLKYYNINSIKNKLFQIENDLDICNNNKFIHFLALTETRILPNETDLFNLPNFKSYFSCREDGHGGAALFVHDSLDSCLIESDVYTKSILS